MMFLKSTTGLAPNEHIIRLSPLIHFDSNTPQDVIPLINKLYALDMDLTTDEEVLSLMECFKAWQNGKLYNQPVEFKVQRNNDLLFIKGDKRYQDGIDRWRRWEA